MLHYSPWSLLTRGTKNNSPLLHERAGQVFCVFSVNKNNAVSRPSTRHRLSMRTQAVPPDDRLHQHLKAAFVALPSLASKGSKVPPACLFTRVEVPTGLSGDGKAFFSLNSVTSYLYQALKSGPKAGWRAMCKPSTKQCFQRPSVREAWVMTLCCSEGWHSYSD